MGKYKPKRSIKSTCSKCGNPLEAERIGRQAYCLKCHAEYMKANRCKHSELNPEQRKRANARAYLKVYVKRGKIEKGPCCICGSTENVEAHHKDYDKPLEVEWYCREHHLKEHYVEVRISMTNNKGSVSKRTVLTKKEIKTACSKCGKPLEADRVGKQCYCLSCHAESMKNYRYRQKVYVESLKTKISELQALQNGG